MELNYLQTLYDDYNAKIKSIEAYTDKLKNRAEELKEGTKEWANNLREKYSLLLKVHNHLESKFVPDGDFALEAPKRKTKTPLQVTQEDLDDLEIKITSGGKALEYSFQKSEIDLQYLVQSYQDLQNLTNMIWSAWEDILTPYTSF